MQPLNDYRNIFLEYLEVVDFAKKPKNLYEPVSYIMKLGGKRMRPVLTLMSCDMFGGELKDALPAAMTIEVFHNFSLVHDDIMDAAPLRRGQATVHEKWDVNTGILSGDTMLIQAYQWLQAYEGNVLKNVLALFSKTAIEVCEGQQYDVDFETRNDVTIAEYLKMIEYKTAVLVAASLKMGAIVAEASESDSDAMYRFGRNLGIAFQLQDDYLDAFGDPKTFGKQVGGDIIENKKTFLYLKAMELAEENDRSQLYDLFNSQPEDPSLKIETVKSLFDKSGAVSVIKDEIDKYTQKSFQALESLNIPEEGKKIFKSFGEDLMRRTV